MSEPVLIAGGSVAALVAADALAARGRSVRLVLPERGLGSGFLPIDGPDRRLELGPRLIELSYDETPPAPPPLSDYRPGPHGHRSYLRLIDEFVRDLVGEDLEPARRPEIVRAGTKALDFLLCGDLIDLPKLIDARERGAIAAESSAARDQLGPAGLLAPEHESDLWTCSFGEASLANHGPAFHEAFVDAIARKVVPRGSDGVVAALRRKIWLPLFHPDSLHGAVTGNLRYRPRRPLLTVAGGGMGVLVARLLDRCRARCEPVSVRSPLASVERGDRDVLLRFQDGSVETAADVVLAGGAEEIFRASGVECSLGRVRTVLAWIDVDAALVPEPPSTLFAVDPDVNAYRVSESTASTVADRVTLTVELGHDTAAENAGAAALESLVAVGLLADAARGTVLRTAAVESFTAPSAENAEAFANARAAFDALELPVEVIGPACGFGADAFNEQVIQGLAVAERLS